MRVKWWIAASLLCLGCPAWAQWVPLNGTQTSTTQVLSADGRVISHRETQERYFRSSSGSVLVQQIADDGTNLPTSGLLLDHGNTRKSYVVDYRAAKAIDKHRPAPASAPMTQAKLPVLLAPGQSAPAEEQVNGVRCVIIPIYVQNPNGSRKLIGRAWAAPDYNYAMMKEDSTRTLPDGRLIHTSRELKNVTAGVEPDAVLFATDAASVRQARTRVPRR